MFNLGKLFSKLKKDENQVHSEPTDAKADTNVQKVRNWYEERYETITVQRNLLFVILLILLCLSVVSIGVVAYVINMKRFDPFVIQIDDTTGIAKIVNPLSSNVLGGNEALARYFIKKYVSARETYNPVDFETLARRNVRLLSTGSVYWSYRGFLRNEEVNPAIKYGQKNTTYMQVKSWSKLAENKYIMRFSIHETAQRKQSFNKIAVVEFEYMPMELTEAERDINPVGFQVTGYRVDDDNS